MSDENPPQSPPSRVRRSSFAGQTLADLFGTNRSAPKSAGPSDRTSTSPPTQQLPGPISQAAAQAQRRRMSLTTLGLSGSPNQTSPYGSYRGHRDSISSGGSIDESAIAEDDGPPRDSTNGNSPTTPFARRTSFGARALRDIRTTSFGGGGGGGPGSPGQNGIRSPPASFSSGSRTQAQPGGTISSRDSKGRGPASGGFNWSDNFRDRAERTSVGSQPAGPPVMGGHSRAKSVAVMEPPPAAAIPKAKEQQRPDHFQERILKGDFYMD